MITVTPDDGEPISITHTRLPVNTANTLAEHGWSTICPGATIPYFTPTDVSRPRRRTRDQPRASGRVAASAHRMVHGVRAPGGRDAGGRRDARQPHPLPAHPTW